MPSERLQKQLKLGVLYTAKNSNEGEKKMTRKKKQQQQQKQNPKTKQGIYRGLG